MINPGTHSRDRGERRRGFELVICVDRGVHAEALREHGADLGELRVSTGAGGNR
ncbi:MAG: hypothetical protein ACM33U_07005 [Solirubrobacterales bacterium]